MKVLRTIAFAMSVALLAATPSGTLAQPAQAQIYTCSMHTNVAEAKAGACPVCSMALKARPMTAGEQSVVDFFKAYDAAFVAKDTDKLATMYAPETTVFEGGGINDGWKNYRDTHLGPELKAYENLEFSHSSVVPHLIGADGAYVTAEYAIKAKTGERVTDSGGLATYALVKSGGDWKIKHTHTSAKRRAPAGGLIQDHAGR